MQTNEKKRSVLVPQYMRNFACIGSHCEDSCCIGWRVNVDEQTYKKYKNSNNTELKPLFEKNISRQRSNSSQASYAKINMGEGGRCSFLSEENLCKVQLNLGEEFLSNTCSIYPRAINRVNDVVEKSATMSCPEAARLALLNEGGIEFDEIEESAYAKGLIVKEINTNNFKVNHKLQKYFWELRIFTIQTLQNRSYTLEQRLIILGLFMNKIQELVNNNLIKEIPASIAQYTNLLQNGSFHDLIENIPTNAAIQMKICKELVDVRLSQSITSQRYLECLTEMLNGIQYTEENTIQQITENYTDAYENYYKPFIDNHEYILENYLVNYVFMHLFPLGKKSAFEDYMMLIVHYSLIKLHLIGIAGFHKELTTDLTIKLIQSFSKTVEHNGAYLAKILKLLKENNFSSIAHMTILIKN